MRVKRRFAAVSHLDTLRWIVVFAGPSPPFVFAASRRLMHIKAVVQTAGPDSALPVTALDIVQKLKAGIDDQK
jgi:hypothetical protein